MLGAAPRSVVDALLNRDAMLAGFARKDELANLDPKTFYPIDLYLELCKYLEGRLGTYAFLRLGRKMGTAVMNRAFPPEVSSVEAAIAHINTAHQMFCKPAVGKFEIVDRGPANVSVEITTPYNCVLQEGLFYEMAIRYGAPNATVTHGVCRRQGAPACRFEVKF